MGTVQPEIGENHEDKVKRLDSVTGSSADGRMHMRECTDVGALDYDDLVPRWQLQQQMPIQ